MRRQGSAQDRQPTPAAAADPISHTRATHGGAHILVVEDDEGTREELARVLEGAGYRTALAGDAREALALAQARRFDLVLTDVNLPGQNGYQLTRALRREGPSRFTPIVLVSGVADSQRRVAALDGGANDFLSKPVDVDELLARIRLQLRQARRERELRQRCRYDPVTGVLNRYAIDEELRRELARSRRSGAPLSVLMVDIDAFKSINDRHGHTRGDEALRLTAARLTELLRAADRVGRYGGDEFLVILPDTGCEDAYALLERLRRSWQLGPPELPRTTTSVTISVGSATARPEETSEQLVRRADEAMYYSKRRKALRPLR